MIMTHLNTRLVNESKATCHSVSCLLVTIITDKMRHTQETPVRQFYPWFASLGTQFMFTVWTWCTCFREVPDNLLQSWGNSTCVPSRWWKQNGRLLVIKTPRAMDTNFVISNSLLSLPPNLDSSKSDKNDSFSIVYSPCSLQSLKLPFSG